MAKKRKQAKKQEVKESKLEQKEVTTQPKTEIQNLIQALETKDNIPMLKSSLPEWTADGSQNIVDSPSFLDANTSPTIKTKLIPETKGTHIQAQRKEYSSTGNLFGDIGVFLTELVDSYGTRYDKWEESTNSVLSVLRKLQAISLDNTQHLVSSIEILHGRISDGLERFQVKRDYVEQYSEANHSEVAQMLKKTLDLLALQIKEFKLKNILNQLISIYNK
jgi:hypothetical protein